MRLPLFSSKRLGIDLGTSNCLVWSSGRGIVLSEPSVVAQDEVTGRIVAVGRRAAEMVGKTAVDLVAKKPLKEGVIADYIASEAMLKHFIERALGYSRFSGPEVMICVPYGITQVERRAVLEAALSAGAKTAYLIDQPLAAAIGAKLPIEAASGSMILDMGGGQVGSAVISLGGIVAASGVRSGGDRLSEDIITYVRRIHNLIIGERMAEEIKITIGSALKVNPVKKIEIRGRDAISGLPKSVSIDSNEVTEAITPTLVSIVNCVKNVLEQTPPELASDIIDKGLVLTGGTAQLRGIDRYISNQIGVSAHLWEDPMHAVVYGTGIALENIDIWRKWVHQR